MRFRSLVAVFAVLAPFSFVVTSACVSEMGTQTRGGECEGPGSKTCRGSLECMAGRCACRVDVCNGGNCDHNGDCIPPAPAASLPAGPPMTALPPPPPPPPVPAPSTEAPAPAPSF